MASVVVRGVALATADCARLMIAWVTIVQQALGQSSTAKSNTPVKLLATLGQNIRLKGAITGFTNSFQNFRPARIGGDERIGDHRVKPHARNDHISIKQQRAKLQVSMHPAYDAHRGPPRFG